jgi:hypothetical protein
MPPGAVRPQRRHKHRALGVAQRIVREAQARQGAARGERASQRSRCCAAERVPGQIQELQPSIAGEGGTQGRAPSVSDAAAGELQLLVGWGPGRDGSMCYLERMGGRSAQCRG